MEGEIKLLSQACCRTRSSKQSSLRCRQIGLQFWDCERILTFPHGGGWGGSLDLQKFQPPLLAIFLCKPALFRVASWGGAGVYRLWEADGALSGETPGKPSSELRLSSKAAWGSLTLLAVALHLGSITKHSYPTGSFVTETYKEVVLRLRRRAGLNEKCPP